MYLGSVSKEIPRPNAVLLSGSTEALSSASHRTSLLTIQVVASMGDFYVKSKPNEGSVEQCGLLNHLETN